jgi:hypothetical protein
MRLIHCDGDNCKNAEDPDKSKFERTIETVTLTFLTDPRVPAAESGESYTADLCDDCREILLHLYFKVPGKGLSEAPLGPRRLHEIPHEPEPESLKA